MNFPTKKKIKAKLARGMLELIVLSVIEQNPSYGYGIIKSLRHDYGVYFGPSTVYPLLGIMEEKGLIKSNWKTPENSKDKPRKMYTLTHNGSGFLRSYHQEFEMIVRRIEFNHRSPVNRKV